MMYRVFVVGWNDVWDTVNWLGASFEMTGRNGYNDPVFDCGVWHADELNGFRRHIASLELIEVFS